MSNYKHTDKEGNETELKDLKLSHLINIINFIKRKSKEGLTVRYGGCGCYAEDMWYDEETYFGKRVKQYFNYKEYKKELERRNNE